MESLIERIKKGHFSQFHGGIHPPEQKFLTSTKPIASARIPTQLTIPVRQHIGQPGNIMVTVGDKVLKGQALSTSDSPMQLPVHAPTSGTITAIKPSVIPHPSGLSETCIMLKPDGDDTWCERTICPDYQLLSKGQILEKIANAGIAGMGGAGFPTQVKVGTLAKINYLIINAAECEPYITADDLLIQEHSPTVIDGIKILDHLLAPKNILIGIEDNKPKAIATLQKATADIDHIHVCVIPTKYPSGGEKQLIKILTDQEVPSGVLPSTLGIVMQNIATCFAIADAVINDTPLIKRVVTISGQALEKPQNTWALIGTPVGFLTDNCGYDNQQHKHLIMGGPMMGFSLSNDQIPVIKSTNCILAPSEAEIASPYSTGSKEVECIRCGQCADVCPAQLLPQELQWSAKAKDQQQLAKLNLFDCIECGACAYVCPSQIPLVHYYRVAKAEIRQQKLLDIKAEKAKVRFEARKERLEREKIARAEKHKKAAEARKARMNSGTTEAKTERSAVAAALARVKAKKAQANKQDDAPSQSVTNSEQVSDQKSQVANAIARAKAKKLAKQVKEASTDTTKPVQADDTVNQEPTSTVNDKKAKVAAAIAKAKAKKKQKQKEGAAQNITEEISVTEKTSTTEVEKSDSNNNSKNLGHSTPSSEKSSDDAIDKNTKIASAVAKAKAKAKAKRDAKSTSGTTAEKNDDVTVDSDIDATTDNSHAVKVEIEKTTLVEKDAEKPNAESSKKAKIAAAVAKAKAKKLAASSSEQTAEPTTTATANNDKKARIAAAVAKAKAKKLAAQTNKSQTSE